MIDMHAVLTKKLERAQRTIDLQAKALEKNGLADSYRDGFAAAIENVEAFVIRITPEFDQLFDHVKEQVLSNLRRNLTAMASNSARDEPKKDASPNATSQGGE